MSKRPLVLLDVDGVLANFVTPALREINWLLGTEHEHDHLTEWDLMKWAGVGPRDEDYLYRRLKRKGFHAQIHPYPGAVEGVKALEEIANIHIVTSPMHGETWCYERWSWLDTHFGFEAHEVTFTHHKGLVVGDYIVDDKLENVSSRRGGLLWNQPWNQTAPQTLKRIGGWAELIEHVKEGR